MISDHKIPLFLLAVTAVTFLAIPSTAQDFDFFYFVLQWPGSYCDTAQKCCYPTTGKPAADFGIHGLWPNYNDGSYPSNCDPDSPYQPSQIRDLRSMMQSEWPTLACPSGNGDKFWEHEWEKHGTCSESVLSQHAYFDTALKFKQNADILQALELAGIRPDGNTYSLTSIRNAIRSATGHLPGIECNTDVGGKSQLYQVYICVDPNATGFIDCPVFPRSNCASGIEFPAF